MYNEHNVRRNSPSRRKKRVIKKYLNKIFKFIMSHLNIIMPIESLILLVVAFFTYNKIIFTISFFLIGLFAILSIIDSINDILDIKKEERREKRRAVLRKEFYNGKNRKYK
jgi:hypothetical protein